MQQFPRCFSLFAYTFISVGLLTDSTGDFIHFSGSLLALPTDSDVGHHESRWVCEITRVRYRMGQCGVTWVNARWVSVG